MIRIVFFSVLLVVLLCRCSSVSTKEFTKTFKATEERFQDHTGFMLYDPGAHKTIVEFNAGKYFTPGSNTKIFTFFCSLKILGDSVPALKYSVRGDSLIFEGTGDPSFLYKNTFNNFRTYNFLSNNQHQLFYSPINFQTTHFGAGWAWDDYNSYYSTERTGLPVYGNIFSIAQVSKTLQITPQYFKQYVVVGDRATKVKITRELNSNQTKFLPGKGPREKVWDIPFKTDPTLTATLLTDTLKKNVSIASIPLPTTASILYSTPVDSIYRVMMQESDNFIAEQLLLACSGVVSDTLKPEIAINYVEKNFFTDLADKPIWVDGSGLSRYNLFTPRSIVQVWEKIYHLMPQDRLFSLLAVGGVSGTIRNWYKHDKPYIYGKTGTLSNNHCLSGYLVTKKGKTLIFAFMNNNFVASTNDIRINMQDILQKIYENY